METSAEHEIDPRRIEALAYELWQTRGSPEGSAEVDWQRAEELLQNDPGIAAPTAAVRPSGYFDKEGFEHPPAARASEMEPQPGGELGTAPAPSIRVF